jgi:cytochrome b561
MATSSASAFSLLKRPFPAHWMDLHLSAGIALLIITLIRIAMMLPFGRMRRSLLSGWRGTAAIKYWLLLVVLAATLTGLPIYQKPPLGRNSYLFNMVSMPTIVRLDHGLHNLVINIHIALSSLLLILMAAHVVAGLRRSQGAGRSLLSAMLWPWRQ